MLRHILKSLTPAFVALSAMTLTSCDSTIFEKEGDCGPTYALSFRYTKNTINEDTFGARVAKINVAVYDEEGYLIMIKSDTRIPTEDNDYRMPISLKPGKYDIITWCFGPAMSEDAVEFSLLGQEINSPITSSGAFFSPVGDSNAGYSFASDLVPLFYGRTLGVECLDTDDGENPLNPITLTKDTNSITVMLQNPGGHPVDASLLEFSISAENSILDSGNVLTSYELPFLYHPWDTTNIDSDGESVSSGITSGVKTEFSTSRLFTNIEQRLSIKRKDSGKTIIDIPLIKYLLLVRSKYQQALNDQDFLDRLDSYSLVFYIDDNYDWMDSNVMVNGWRVAPPTTL